MLISLHTPKAGGSSFKSVLKDHFGKGFVGDYADVPINKSFEKRTNDALNFDRKLSYLNRKLYKIKGIECIHGHFMPFKYRKFSSEKNVNYITWLRDPVERLVSHYYYWQRAYRETSAPLHKRVVEEKWSLEEFCFSEEFQNIYSKFLWRFPIETFDFIGITEYFDEDLTYFSKRFLCLENMSIPRQNVNPNRIGKYASDLPFLEKLKAFHEDDYMLYEQALERRRTRFS